MLTIVIITYNIHSEIFLMQIEAIRKFCLDHDFIIEVIDNSSNPDCAEAIRYHSQQLGVEYLKTYAISLGGSESHAFAANLSYQRLKDNDSDYFFYLDHDCIPVKFFSVEEILGKKIMAGIGQVKPSKKKYLWQGCVMWNNEKVDNDLLDFSPNSEFGLDTGGNLYKVIEKYGEDQIIFFDEAYCQNPYYNGKYNAYALINNGMFLHCVALSGWNEGGANQERVSSMINIVRDKIDTYVD